MTNKSGPHVTFGQVDTPAQWNAIFAQFGEKVDAAGGTASGLTLDNATLTDTTTTRLTVNGGVLHDVTIFTKPGAGGVFSEGTTKYVGAFIAGKPGVAQAFYISVPFTCMVPAQLVGSTIYAGTVATADATFALNRVTAGNAITALGTITITNAGHFSAISAGTGGLLGAGDAIQIVCPGSQDTTLSDVAITIVAARL